LYCRGAKVSILLCRPAQGLEFLAMTEGRDAYPRSYKESV